ncbi:hypothetical protein LCGC14_2523600 [marine sediment metagenome]|uniref:Uncharacterized protein n=1 Tax=marine sediment metagenome TaxID=412755 RepID=A0A0F9AVM9_9ZZZZ
MSALTPYTDRDHAITINNAIQSMLMELDMTMGMRDRTAAVNIEKMVIDELTASKQRGDDSRKVPLGHGQGALDRLLQAIIDYINSVDEDVAGMTDSELEELNQYAPPPHKGE